MGPTGRPLQPTADGGSSSNSSSNSRADGGLRKRDFCFPNQQDANQPRTKTKLSLFLFFLFCFFEKYLEQKKKKKKERNRDTNSKSVVSAHLIDEDCNHSTLINIKMKMKNNTILIYRQTRQTKESRRERI